jgi:hypothetical protein
MNSSRLIPGAWVSLFVLGVGLGLEVQAAGLVLNNPSFENPAYAPGQWGVGIPGWQVTAGAQAGIQNVPSATPSGTPDGQQVAFLNLIGSVSQTLAETVQAGTTYTLTVELGQSIKLETPTGYAVQLCAGEEVLAQASPPVIPGQFVPATVTFTTPDGDPRIGLPLRVVVLKSTAVYAQQLLFDHVRLDATQVGAPLRIRPNGGEFTNSVTVSLASYVVGTVVRYTLDGTEPVGTSPRYDAPFPLTEAGTVQARLFVGTAPASEIVRATFKKAPDVAIQPAGGLFTNSVDVVIRNHLNVGTLLFTLDGTDPVASSPAYTTPFKLTAAATVKAGLWLNGFPISAVASANFLRVYAVDDGIPNAWREEHFGPGYLTDPRVGALEDPDHDGATNLQEYAAGSDPLDELSGFAVGIQAVPQVAWVSVPGQVYRILRKASLQDAAWTVIVPEFQATRTNSTYVDVEVAGQRAFYTVQPAGP